MISVTRIRPAGGKDKYGDPDADAATETEIAGCAVAPRFSSEPTERGRQGVIVGLTLYAPFGSDILATDQIQVPDDSNTYDVEGIPGSWTNPFTDSDKGMEIALKRAAG